MPEIKPSPGPAHPEQATTAAARPDAAIADNFRRAIAHHQRGQLAQAQTLYREILGEARDHFDALHMLGVIEYQRGRHVAAIELFTQALATAPDNFSAHVNKGNALHALGRGTEALASYDHALRLGPDYATAHYNKGILLQDLERLDEALASYERALHLEPDHVDARVRHGTILRKLNRPADALASIDRVLLIDPDHTDALVNRGITLRMLNRSDEALTSYDRALRLKPDHVGALVNRGKALQTLTRHAEALASLDHALELKPGLPDALRSRGDVLLDLNRPADAAAAYRQALGKDRNPEQIKYLTYALAALGTGSQPGAAPPQFITNMFDQYAERFDQHLVGTLNYQAPTLLSGLIMRFCTGRDLDILDLGCGTGLLGPLLKPLARTITGVDLSPGMLEKARLRGVYDELIHSELTAFLQTRSGSFDLAVATDVFIYIGDLSAVFAGVRSALRNGGWFGFSIEANEGEDFVLRPTRRYAQSVAYIEKLASRHGFVITHLEPRAIRLEKGVGMPGCLALLRCR